MWYLVVSVLMYVRVYISDGERGKELITLPIMMLTDFCQYICTLVVKINDQTVFHSPCYQLTSN